MSKNVGKGFNLVMELRDPARLGELMQKLGSDAVRPRLQEALGALDYVHYSRFLPIWDRGLLLIVTEFDGAMQDYVMDFAAALDGEFSLILSYMKGYDVRYLPVSAHPNEFWAYVDRNTGPKLAEPGKLPPYPDPFCAYPDKTVLDITGGRRPKGLPKQPPVADEAADGSDVQGHVLHGFRAKHASYLGFRFTDAAKGCAMLRDLAPMISKDSERGKPACITLGLTHAGLQALGLPQRTLEEFPRAFREGPRLRKVRLGDVGRSDPEHWTIAGFEGGSTPETLGKREPVVLHGVVSVYCTGDAGALSDRVLEVRSKMNGNASVAFEKRAEALGELGEIHFGYRDGIGQPRFPEHTETPKRSQQATPLSPTGDVLLGRSYRNSRGGYYIGELPDVLAKNGTYAALRVIEQDVVAFEQFLQEVEARKGVARETMAAKLAGRWRNGSALSLNPQQPDPLADKKASPELDTFDYAKPPADFDDNEGRRCPFGAHIRRVNPRGGMVLGVPWGRRVVRRGMPYGPRFDPQAPADEVERGLVGLFLCADLESQFEFMQHAWANEDLSAPGLRGTQDPFTSRDSATPFRFCPLESRDEIEVMVPPLTRTIGSAYLFMPGINGLQWLASQGWGTTQAAESADPPAHSRMTRGTTMTAPVLDATSPQFIDNPYLKYAELREKAAVGWVDPPYGMYWVFSHGLVTEVNQRRTEFLKPGKARTGSKSGPFAVTNHLKDGLFFMDKDRHDDVRPLMDGIFHEAIAKAQQHAENVAQELLDAALKNGQMDAIREFAGPLAERVFFQVMGVPETACPLVNDWVRTALDSHRETMPPLQRLRGGTVSLAMRMFLRGLQQVAPQVAPGSILAGMQGATVCGASGKKLDPDEAMNTAGHFALGGYLSTEFLIGTGIYNLLRHPEQWQQLRRDRSLMPRAIDEMLRYDAPFQLADRWVENDTKLGSFTIPAGSVFAVAYGSANRDPAVFADPDRFDITRSQRKSDTEPTPNYGFGDGMHRCIGEWLARPVTAVAVAALLERCPTARIGEVGPWAADPYFRSLTKLQLLLR